MAAEAREKLVAMLWQNASGSIRNPVTIKKIGMKNEFPKNSSFSLCRLIVNRRVDRQPRQERPDDARQVDGLGDDASHRHDPEHQYEICVLVILHLLQRVPSHATQTKQDERDKDSDLYALHRRRHRKAALISRNADCEHDQGQRCSDRTVAPTVTVTGSSRVAPSLIMVGIPRSVCDASRDPNYDRRDELVTGP